MYNLNVNVSTAGTPVNNLLAVENAANTPRTPEILNSLIAMTNPLDNYNFNGNNGNKKDKNSCPQNVSNDSNSSSCSHEETSTSSPPSVQHTCSQLIKAGLKLSIESKRKLSETHDDFLDMDIHPKRVRKSECELDDGDGSLSPNQGLTPEDEERRRRRRERNKIAATKCRLKKREKTVNLVHESEVLETQNIDLKTQIQELESQRRRLVDMLSMHGPACVKQTNNRDHYPATQSYIVEESNYSADGTLPPVTSLTTSVIETNQSYRPSSVDNQPYRSPNLDCFGRSSSVGITNDSYNRPNSLQYVKPPSIIVEGENYSPPHLTNLDNSNNQVNVNSFTHYNTNQCHNYNQQSTNQNYGSPNIDNGCMA